MFTKWEEVYNENITLMTQVSSLLDDKSKLKSEVIHYKSLLIDKDKRLLAVTTKLENTKKSLKMMNSRTQKLDHILLLGINTNAISVNVQVYTTSNIMISIQDHPHRD